MEKKIKILDCTLRDGGYYNNWNFEKKIVDEYVKNINKSKIDVVEVGFRFFSNHKFLGKFATISDKNIKKLGFNKNIELAIMINASELIKASEHKSVNDVTNSILNNSKKSPVKYIRIASHFHEIKKLEPYLKNIKKLGYKIIVNVMQASQKKEKLFKEIIVSLKKTKTVDVLYFADSLGNMLPEEIKKICKYFKKYWKNDFGFHSHDNMGYALINSVTAHKNGAKWLDATISGMGRGAGNVKTESLLTELTSIKKLKYKINPIYHLSNNIFLNLKKKYNWGNSIYYHIAAIKNIHPTYVQSILEEKKYSNLYVLKLLDKLGKMNSTSFYKKYLEKIFRSPKNVEGSWCAKSWCKNKKVLILAQGEDLKNKKDKVEKFIDQNKPKVLSLNINEIIHSSKINYYVASNYERVVYDYPKYSKLKKSLIIPHNIFSKFLNKLKNINSLDYGLMVKPGKIQAFDKYCQIHTQIVLAYALCLCGIGAAKQIYLAGFDGYNDPTKNKINQDILNRFIKRYINIEIFPLTKTIYKI